MRLRRIILTTLLLLALSPAANAAPPVKKADGINCTLSFNDEETDTCYYVNFIINCGSDGACSVTVSACDDGNGGFDLAVVAGCT
jgi:hypothetical protein